MPRPQSQTKLQGDNKKHGRDNKKKASSDEASAALKKNAVKTNKQREERGEADARCQGMRNQTEQDGKGEANQTEETAKGARMMRQMKGRGAHVAGASLLRSEE